jgi:hypothetical protein
MQIFCLHTLWKHFILFIENRDKFQAENLLRLLSGCSLCAVPECFNLHSAREDLLFNQRVMLSESEKYSQMLKYKDVSVKRLVSLWRNLRKADNLEDLGVDARY